MLIGIRAMRDREVKESRVDDDPKRLWTQDVGQ